ncbi:MAG TPA: response regulator, partial [Candidatus Acidoferrum sp.]|nr:response regulator [Candidatus Acidoferrum sp.]
MFAIVIDDSAADRQLAEILLKHAGFDVESSGDGRSGLDLIKRMKPDLVITDLITPTIDGYELAREVRADPGTASILIIMVTAHYLEAEVHRLASQIRIQQVVIKPFEPQVFLDAITKAMGDKTGLDGFIKLPAGNEFHIRHLRTVAAKLYEKVRELEATRLKLDRTASRYQLLLKAHPEPIWVFDVETLRFLEVNDTAVHLYGYSREEFLAMTIRDIYPEADAMGLAEISAPKLKNLDHSGPWRHRKKDGSLIAVETTTHDLVFGGRPARYLMAQNV